MGKKTKEDAFTGMDLQLAGTRARRANPNATTKCAGSSEVRTYAGSKKIRRARLVLERERIFDPKVGMECIGPKMSIKISANQHGTESVTNGLMGPLDGTILVRAVGTSRAYSVTMALKQSSNFLIVVKFAALVQVYILVGNLGSMLLEPITEPAERCTFGDARCAVKCRGGMIGE
jgi:hypothetical protein